MKQNSTCIMIIDICITHMNQKFEIMWGGGHSFITEIHSANT